MSCSHASTIVTKYSREGRQTTLFLQPTELRTEKHHVYTDIFKWKTSK